MIAGSSLNKMNCIHRRKAVLLFVAVSLAAHILCRGETSTSSTSTSSSKDNNNKNDRIVQSLFRFPASQLGPEFDSLLQDWYKNALYIATTHAYNNHSNTSSTSSLPNITPEASGKSHAFHSVSTPAATLFRRQCYKPAPIQTSSSSSKQQHLYNLYKNFEQRRKEISFQYIKDSNEEMRLLHTIAQRFYPAFLPPNDDEENGITNNNAATRIHKKKSRSTVNTIHAQTNLPSHFDTPRVLAFQTGRGSSSTGKEGHTDDKNEQFEQTQQQQWSWHPPAHFSSRGTSNNMSFRRNMYKSMRTALQSRIQQLLPNFNFEHGRQSGMFWYPPGGVREWHTNALDLVGNTKKKINKDSTSGSVTTTSKEEAIFETQVWRMYYVRTVRDTEFDAKLSKLRKKQVDTITNEGTNDHSAMHIIPGKDGGITLDVLRKAGARLLNENEKKRQWSDEFAEEYSAIPPAATTEKNKVESTTTAAANNNNDDDTDFDRNSVWRLPDQDGYVTLFRIPDIWHCIVSEEVHRYSLGFAFSDREVQALLTLAGVDFDVVVVDDEINEEEHDDRAGSKDEL